MVVESPKNSNHVKPPQPSKLSGWYVDVEFWGISTVLRITWLHGLWWFWSCCFPSSPSSFESYVRTPCKSFAASPKLATGMQRGGYGVCRVSWQIDILIYVADGVWFELNDFHVDFWNDDANQLIVWMGWSQQQTLSKAQNPLLVDDETWAYTNLFCRD